MNRPFITLLLSILPFPVTFAGEITLGETQIINNQPCIQLLIEKNHGERQEFCMTSIDQQTLKTDKMPETQKHITLLASDNQTTDHHGATGNLGFSVQEFHSDETQYIVNENLLNIPIGSFGKAPEEFEFYEIGDNNFGYIVETSNNYQGVESGGIHIIGENNGEIFHQYIPTHADDFGYHGDEEIAETISYTMAFQDDQESAIFPILITLNGKYDGKEYQNRDFLLVFDEEKQKYIKPDNYPALF